MQKMFSLLLLSWIGSIAFSGCTTITLHPVTDKDIKMQDGWVCMTPEYIQTVMKAKLETK